MKFSFWPTSKEHTRKKRESFILSIVTQAKLKKKVLVWISKKESARAIILLFPTLLLLKIEYFIYNSVPLPRDKLEVFGQI